MRESDFIEQNREKWQEFERILEKPGRDPEKLGELFVHITDDLSYSRTFYPNRSVRVYLNDLAQKVFLRLYQNRSSPLGRLVNFWTDELPRLVYEARSAFRLSFLVFAAAFFLGVLSSAMDPEFAKVILGENYVEMTLENIESGNPMAVYKQRGRFSMSFGITVNNLYVAFLTFVMGAFFAIGSLAILIQNGIMVGAFQYFFIERGIFWESFLTIWTHGTLEISAIIIAGAAGITMGRGLLYPGSLTRLQSFQRSARRGVKIMIGISPIILMAGFIEGYLTRQTEAPFAIRLFFILACLAFVIVYFVWYPRLRHRTHPHPGGGENEFPSARPANIDFHGILSPGELFAEVFQVFRLHAGKIFLLCLLSSLLFTASAILFSPAPLAASFSFPNSLFGTLSVIDQFFVNPALPWLPLLNLFLFSILTVGMNHLVIREEKGSDYRPQPHWISAVKCLAGLAVMQLIIWSQDWFTVFLVLLLFPLPMLWNVVVQAEGVSPGKALQRTLRLLKGQYGRGLSLFLTLSVLGLLFFSVLDTVMLWFFLDLVSWVVRMRAESMEAFSLLLLVEVAVFLLHLVSCMLLIGIALLYYTLIEISGAHALRTDIRQIGKRRHIQGLEREN